jgi:hypothetical protein
MVVAPLWVTLSLLFISFLFLWKLIELPWVFFLKSALILSIYSAQDEKQQLSSILSNFHEQSSQDRDFLNVCKALFNPP